MATIHPPAYLLDQAKRRFTPSFNNFPGMSLVEHMLLNTKFPEKKLRTAARQRAQAGRR